MKKVILKVKDLACPDCAAKIGSGMFFHEVSVILVILNGMRLMGLNSKNLRID